MTFDARLTLKRLLPAMALTLAASAFAQTATIKIGYITARNSHFGDGATAFCDTVEKGSNGRYKCAHGPSGAFGGEKDMFEQLKDGSLDVAHISIGVLPQYVPEVGIFEVPFLFRDYPHARHVLDGPIGQRMLDDNLRKAGFVALAWSENGFRHVTNNKHPVLTPEDLKGLKVRTMENKIHTTAFRSLGMEPKPLPLTAVFEALQTGAVDGQENPISMILANKFAQVQKYLSLTGHVYSTATLMVSPKLWNTLSDADKKLFQSASKNLAQATRTRVEKDEREGVDALKAKGMQVVMSVDKNAFSSAMKSARNEFEQQFGAPKLAEIAAVK